MNKAIVIGAGFGGIASALRLRAKGYDVVIIDQREKLGGRAQQFNKEGYIFDAGPTVETQTASVKTIRQSKKRQVIIGEVANDNNYIICNDKVADFRATQAAILLRDTAKQVVLSQTVADALMVKEGDWVRLVSN